MESLKHKLQNFQAAYRALEQAIQTQNRLAATATDDLALDNLMTAGIIQHFELAYETSWKFLKQLLYDLHQIETASPRSVFQACLQQKILPESVINELILLADTRNQTTHIYDLVLAKEVNSAIDCHYLVFGKILQLVQIPA